jgi:hypothetical protein
MSHQRSYTTVAEGGIPPVGDAILDLVGGSDQSHPSQTTARDARISSVSIESSPAIPEARNDESPANWPTEMRGVPDYRPLDRHVDYESRPMGQNNIEYTFLLFMFTGVRITGVSGEETSLRSYTASADRRTNLFPHSSLTRHGETLSDESRMTSSSTRSEDNGEQ